jgi:hypothetical protein
MTRTDEIYLMWFAIMTVVVLGMALDRLGLALMVTFALGGVDRQLKRRRERRSTKRN